MDVRTKKRTQDPGGPEIQQGAENDAVHNDAERIPAHNFRIRFTGYGSAEFLSKSLSKTIALAV